MNSIISLAPCVDDGFGADNEKIMKNLSLPTEWIEKRKNYGIGVNEYFWTPDNFLSFDGMSKELLKTVREKTGGSFYKFSLDEQAAFLSIELDEIIVDSRKIDGKTYWYYDDQEFLNVEDLGFAYFQKQGWEGLKTESHIISLGTFLIGYGLKKETGEPLYGYLKRHKAWVDPENHIKDVENFLKRRVSLKWVCKLYQSNPDYFINVSRGKPEDIDKLVYAWHGLGIDFFQRIVLHAVRSSIPFLLNGNGGALSGWSDLTLWRGDGQVKFVEIKQRDKLHRNQAYWIRNYVMPLDFNMSILRVKAR